MTVYYHAEAAQVAVRLHPYEAGTPEQSGFVDFKVNPDLIPEVLEDFRPFEKRPAIQTFYRLLAWVNGPTSKLESNDCGLRPPKGHSDPNSSLALVIHGRVCLLFRDLYVNSSRVKTDWLCSRLMKLLEEIDASFAGSEGVVGLSMNPILQTAISLGSWHADGSFEAADDDPGFGQQLTLSFWAYGQNETEAFGNLERLFENIWSASRMLNGEIN